MHLNKCIFCNLEMEKVKASPFAQSNFHLMCKQCYRWELYFSYTNNMRGYVVRFDRFSLKSFKTYPIHSSLFDDKKFKYSINEYLKFDNKNMLDSVSNNLKKMIKFSAFL